MIAKVHGSKICGSISAIVSKSYAHRIAICNFLAGKEPTANCGGFISNDISVTQACLKNAKMGERILNCGESGSTLRFLIPLMATLGGEYTFTGEGRLMQRPNEPLFKVLNEHGIATSQGDCVRISGKLTSGDFLIAGDVSSQYVSGLLMALPKLDGDSKIILTTPLASKPYVDITIQVLEKFNVKIEQTEYGYFIKGNQKYQGDMIPEGDWSNSSFFLVAGALSNGVSMSGLNIKSCQGDKAIIDILKSAGASVSISSDMVTVSKLNLSAFTFDFNHCPDLVPIACVLASFCKGTSVLKNIKRLTLKESDRVKTCIEMLSAFNIKATTDGDNLYVYGGEVKGGEIDSFNDHRIVMSSAILGANCDGATITNAQAVNKSYPTFFEHLALLGGKVDVI